MPRGDVDSLLAELASEYAASDAGASPSKAALPAADSAPVVDPVRTHTSASGAPRGSAAGRVESALDDLAADYARRDEAEREQERQQLEAERRRAEAERERERQRLVAEAERERQRLAAEAERERQRLAAEAERERKLQAERRAALRGEAAAWLKKLDPDSSEGMWFHALAERFPTPLDAAIEYLATVKQRGPTG